MDKKSFSPNIGFWKRRRNRFLYRHCERSEATFLMTEGNNLSHDRKE